MDGSGTRDWVFTVKCRTRPGEVVCVTGSCEALGRWRSGGVARMTRVDDAADDDAAAASDEEPMVLKDEAMDLSKKGGGYDVHLTSTFSTVLFIDPTFTSKHGTWTVTVKIPAGEEVHFRYCVALFVDAHVPMSHQVEGSDFSDDGTKTVIRRYILLICVANVASN